jgi:hypothetical protein
MRRDFPGSQAFRRQRQHHVFHPGQPALALALAHDLGFETAVTVAGHVDGHRTDLGQHRLGACAVAGVPTVLPGRVVLVVAQVVSDLPVQRGLHNQLRQPLQQSALSGQLQTVGAGLLDQLTNELLIQGVQAPRRAVPLLHRVSIDLGRHYISHQVLLLDQELHRCFQCHA